MTTSTRARILRLTVPAAAATLTLTLTACGSTPSANSDPATSPAATSTATADDATSGTATMPPGTATPPTAQDSAPKQAATSATAAQPSSAVAGTYITLAEYQDAKDAYAGTDVVLFFNADWCSTCKQARDTITAEPSAIPPGLTIVTVDYDSADDLKRRYGVTVQHTFVQIDDSGQELARWSGSVTAKQIAENTV